MRMCSAGWTQELVEVRPQGILTCRGQFTLPRRPGGCHPDRSGRGAGSGGCCPVCSEPRAGLEAGAAPSSVCLDVPAGVGRCLSA